MKKILFRRLLLEITRRCQLKCAHCFRGDAQNYDMPTEIIDAFLEQTAGIEELLFTGGEPTLAVDRMKYTLEQIKQRNIPLYRIIYITNGVALTDAVKDFLLDAYEYISFCRETTPIFDDDPVMYYEPRIHIEISLDNFHTGVNKKELLKMNKSYKRIFQGKKECVVSFTSNSIPSKVGRGKNLENAIDVDSFKELKDCAVCMADREHKIICDDYLNSQKIFNYCDAFIPCRLVVSAKGRLFQYQYSDEYDMEDGDAIPYICQFEDGKLPDIYDAIRHYNQDRIPCYISANVPKNISAQNILAISRFQTKYDYDTDTDTSYAISRSYETIDEEKMESIMGALDDQRVAYHEHYKKYLLSRIEKYGSQSEITMDFPGNNKLFYEEVIRKKDEFWKYCDENSAELFVDWIYNNKDKTMYTIDNSLVDTVVPVEKRSFFDLIKLNKLVKGIDAIIYK